MNKHEDMRQRVKAMTDAQLRERLRALSEQATDGDIITADNGHQNREPHKRAMLAALEASAIRHEQRLREIRKTTRK